MIDLTDVVDISELKPCPCCLSTDIYEGCSCNDWIIICNSCGISSPMIHDGKYEVRKIWNRRSV